MTESRRRNFTDEEDLQATLIADDSFPRENLSGKIASGRFDKLAKAHSEHDAEAATLSGVSEEESERVLLLDEIVALIDDHAARVRAASLEATESLKRQREEKASLAARRLAIETLGNSSEECIPPKRHKEAEVKDLLISLKEREIADTKAALEEMALQRAQERREDRVGASRVRQEGAENMLKLVGAATESILAIIQAQKSK
ncbi:hypothetical protein PI124_g16906 [Phytophthora idaei]|nr:hypothetical protein PI124_g16906 [Phytophthora idaei]